MPPLSTEIIDLTALADGLLTSARAASAGRASQVFHAKDGGLMSQIVLGFTAG